MQNQEILRIAIVGPESTGKSELAAALAAHYQTIWVREYAREYLTNRNGNYAYNDLLKIAQGQVHLEDDAVSRIRKGEISFPLFQQPVLIMDTTLLVIKIWSEFKYGRCDAWIEKENLLRKYHFHLLTAIDLPWQPDPLREHPGKRQQLFDIYLNELTAQKATFGIVTGAGTDRFNNAVNLVSRITGL